jgi:putative ABC transport system permease protein
MTFRYALRTLWRTPGFTVSAVLAIALGVGANGAVFAVVHGVLLKPLPYPEPQRLVRIAESNLEQGIDAGPVSSASFVAWHDRSRTLEHVAVYFSRQWLVSFDGTFEEVQGAIVSPALFQTLGVSPLVGRPFPLDPERAAASEAAREILIGYGVWQRHFGGRHDVVGRTVSVEGRATRTIIGVMPAGFGFPGRTEMWAIETLDGAIGPNQRQARWRDAVGRLRRGVTPGEADVELRVIAAQLDAEHPDSHGGWQTAVRRLDASLTEPVRPALLILLAAVGSVLLVACANVANLTIARATARRHEMAVRRALGASHGALGRQWLAEGVLVAGAGGAAGLLLARVVADALRALAPAETPRLEEIAVGGPVLMLVAAISAGAALLMAVVPLLQSRHVAVQDDLKRGGRTTSGGPGLNLRAWLIGAQVALTFVLLVSAGLLLRSFVELRNVDLGFEPRGVLTADTRLATGRFPDRRPWHRLLLYYGQLLDELAGVPGVQAVGGIAGLPLTGDGAAGNVRLVEPGTGPRTDVSARDAQSYVSINIVTPGYFPAMRIPIVRGRAFDESDRLSAEALTEPDTPRPRGVAIVNEAMARRFWPGQDPIGRSLEVLDHWAVESSVIVGIAADVRQDGVASPAQPAVYVPFGEVSGFRLSLVIRTTVPPASLAAPVLDRLRHVDPQLMVSNVRPLDAVVMHAVAGPRFNLLLVGSFAVLALALAAIGIYGVVAYLVSQRTREFGIRFALGARREHVLRLVVRDGLRPVLLGAAAGAAGAVVAAHALGGLLFGVAPLDPASFAGVPVLVLTVALAAAALPAWRASRFDPILVLRDE